MTCFNCELNCPSGPSMCILQGTFCPTPIKSKPTTGKQAHMKNRLSIRRTCWLSAAVSAGCGPLRARDFLGDVLVVDKGPRDWGGLGGLSGGDMIVKQPDMKLDDLLDDLVYYYDGLADQKSRAILTQSYDSSWILKSGAQIRPQR
ncbi:MAG: hypothetical protein ACLSAH_18040 [Bilophila wadsworthia]